MARALKNDDGDEHPEEMSDIAALVEHGQWMLKEVRKHPREHLAWFVVPAVLGMMRLMMMARAHSNGRTIHIEFAFRPSTTIAISLFRRGALLPKWLKA